MNKKIIIRKAKPEDAKSVAKVHVDSWIETYSGHIPDEVLSKINVNQREKMWEEIIIKNKDFLFLATINDSIIGFLSAGRPRDLVDSADIEIFALYLLKNYHKQRIGYQLYKRLIKEVGTKNILIWVLENNPHRTFYERIGGSVISSKNEEIFGTIVKEVAYLVSTNE